jgi:hypothetical protein
MNPLLRNFLFFAGGFAAAYVLGIFVLQRAVIKQKQADEAAAAAAAAAGAAAAAAVEQELGFVPGFSVNYGN